MNNADHCDNVLGLLSYYQCSNYILALQAHLDSISDGRVNNSYKTTKIFISNVNYLVGLIPGIQGIIPHPITFRIAFPLKPVLIFKTSIVVGSLSNK